MFRNFLSSFVQFFRDLSFLDFFLFETVFSTFVFVMFRFVLLFPCLFFEIVSRVFFKFSGVSCVVRVFCFVNCVRDFVVFFMVLPMIFFS